MLKSAEKLTLGEFSLNCHPWLVWLLIVLLLLFSIKFCYCDKIFHCFVQMFQFLLNGECREAAEPRCCRLEDRVQKAAKRLIGEWALPVPRKPRHQDERTRRNWSCEGRTAAVLLGKTAAYNHLRLKHGKDTPPKQIVWSRRWQL